VESLPAEMLPRATKEADQVEAGMKV
jgi:hypothetical protein